MEYSSWQTDFDHFKAIAKQRRQRVDISADVFYAKRIEDTKKWFRKSETWRQFATKALAELAWETTSRPYYKVHPELVSRLIRVNLEKIPAPLVEVPHGHRVVNIQLAQAHPELTLKESVSDETGMNVVWPVGSFVNNILLADTTVNWGKKGILILIDFGIKTEHGQQSYMSIPMVLPDKDLQTVFNEIPFTNPASPDVVRVQTNVLKLIITIGFLANSSDDLIEYDVLSKYRQEFQDASESRRREIIEKSRRRGKVGYNVGNDWIFLENVPFGQSNQSESTGRQLKYAHIRTGHAHAVRYGPQRRNVKIMWFRPTVVREDLPFKRKSE